MDGFNRTYLKERKRRGEVLSLLLSVGLHGGLILLLSGFIGNWGMRKVQEQQVEATSQEVFVEMVEFVPAEEMLDVVSDDVVKTSEDIPVEEKAVRKTISSAQEKTLPVSHPDHKTAPVSSAASEEVRKKGVVSVLHYADVVREHLTRYKFYPVRAQRKREEGRVVVGFSVGRSGQIVHSKILSTSFSHSLDQAALEAVQRAVPFPLPPETLTGQELDFKVPLVYSLR